METLIGVLFVYLIAAAIGMAVLYWVIRLAVRGGIHDAQKPRVAKQAAPSPAAPTWFSNDA